MVAQPGCWPSSRCVVLKAVELGTAVPFSARLETRTKESMELAG